MAELQKQFTKIKPKRTELGETLPTKAEEKTQSHDGIIGLHVFGNLYDLDPEVMSNVNVLKSAVLEAIKIARMTLVEEKAWAFGGKKGGVSVIALITESHIALHTWHEYKYATLDIYTCGNDADPQAAFDYIVKTLKPKRHQLFYADRSM